MEKETHVPNSELWIPLGTRLRVRLSNAGWSLCNMNYERSEPRRDHVFIAGRACCWVVRNTGWKGSTSTKQLPGGKQHKLASFTFLMVLSFWPCHDHNSTLWLVRMGFCSAWEKYNQTRGLALVWILHLIAMKYVTYTFGPLVIGNMNQMHKKKLLK